MTQPTQCADETPAKHGALASATPPPGAAADWTVPQHWEELTAEDHWVWDTLFARQQTLLHGRAVAAFQEGLDVLHLSRPGVPNFEELNQKLGARTGWEVVAVPGLVPDDVFFEHLSHRRFPAGNFIRQAKQLDYLEEPDVFHDVFGHVPLLAEPWFADFMQGWRARSRRSRERRASSPARLYWYTVSSGSLARRAASRFTAPASSRASANPIIRSKAPSPTGWASISSACSAPLPTDAFQQSYFVIELFEDVLKLVQHNDFERLYDQLEPLPTSTPPLRTSRTAGGVTKRAHCNRLTPFEGAPSLQWQ